MMQMAEFFVLYSDGFSSHYLRVRHEERNFMLSPEMGNGIEGAGMGSG
jgi:hypothetical protein